MRPGMESELECKNRMFCLLITRYDGSNLYLFGAGIHYDIFYQYHYGHPRVGDADYIVRPMGRVFFLHRGGCYRSSSLNACYSKSWDRSHNIMVHRAGDGAATSKGPGRLGGIFWNGAVEQCHSLCAHRLGTNSNSFRAGINP